MSKGFLIEIMNNNFIIIHAFAVLLTDSEGMCRCRASGVCLPQKPTCSSARELLLELQSDHPLLLVACEASGTRLLVRALEAVLHLVPPVYF